MPRFNLFAETDDRRVSMGVYEAETAEEAEQLAQADAPSYISIYTVAEAIEDEQEEPADE